jgi:glycosyltransferase involved in cell wall biosynthesis
MLENVRGSQRRRLIEQVKSLYLRAFDGFLVGGKAQIAYLRTLRVSRDKIAVGYACVDNHRIELLVRGARHDSRRLLPADYLLTVSRLVDRKNTAAIVRALSTYVRALRQGAEPFHLVIVGDGPERSRLEALAENLHVADLVHFTGELSEFEEVVRYYAFASAFVLASWFEPWGLVLNEAMAAGLPVVAASQVGAAADLIEEGVNGFTFEANSDDGLAVILRRLHDMRADLHGLGTASRSIVDRFSPEVFGANAASFLNNRPPQSPSRSA